MILLNGWILPIGVVASGRVFTLQSAPSLLLVLVGLIMNHHKMSPFGVGNAVKSGEEEDQPSNESITFINRPGVAGALLQTPRYIKVHFAM